MTLSVWIITYNQEDFIAQAIESVLMQKTNFDFEIVIGEDASTDNTRKILLEYKNKYPNKIKLLLHEKNIGMIANQNSTFSACSGKYIAMLEGDDFWTNPNKLQIQYDLMLKHPECDLSFHAVSNTKRDILNNYGEKIKIFTIEETIVGGGYFVSTPSIMVKIEVINKMPQFLDNAPAGDYYIQIFGAISGGLLYIPNNMATYRMQAKGSWSESLSNKHIKERFMERTLSMIQELDIYFDYKYTKAFQKRYQDVALFLCMDYIYSNKLDKFKKLINKISLYIVDKNMKYNILYFFKNKPYILLYLSKFLQKIKFYNKAYNE